MANCIGKPKFIRGLTKGKTRYFSEQLHKRQNPFYGVFELLDEGFPFQNIDLTANYIESGTYKVGYRIIVSNLTGVKLEKYYETDITLDVVSAMPEQGEEIIG